MPTRITSTSQHLLHLVDLGLLAGDDRLGEGLRDPLNWRKRALAGGARVRSIVGRYLSATAEAPRGCASAEAVPGTAG
ncbi:MAG: hypothetical protein V9G19_22450 [Tetrasphaera sp.]